MENIAAQPLDDVLFDKEKKHLYSPLAVGLFTFFGSVLFGTALLAMNMRTLKIPGGATKVWVSGLAIFIMQILIGGELNTNFGSMPAFLINIAVSFLLSKVLYPYYIQASDEYERRSVMIPLVILIAIYILCIVLLASTAFYILSSI